MARSALQVHRTARPPALQRALLRLQRGVQRRLQAELRAYTGGNSPALERYYRDYLRDFRRQHTVSNYGDLHVAMLDADVILVGDYHTLRQSQETALRLLERAIVDPRPVALALEMVHTENQAVLDQFMSGALDETEFLAAIAYRDTWNFEWGNYRPLFEAARQAGVRVFGVNERQTTGGLRERDARIAARLVEIGTAAPDARLIVLIGDLHLASNHLPAALGRGLAAAGLERQSLVVHQNSDSLYWSLAERGNEARTQVVRLGADRFCVMEVPPYVKLQSYLGWERRQAEGRLGAGDAPGDEDEDEFWDDDQAAAGADSVVQHLAGRLAEFLGLPPVVAAFSVYANVDAAFFEALAGAGLSAERAREIQLLAGSSRGCWVPELNAVYLPHLSVNHAAEEALHVLQWQASGFDTGRDDAYEDFYARALFACLGYAASKIVNPRRRTTTDAELRAFLGAASRRMRVPDLAFRKRVARFVIQHREHEAARRDGGRGRLKQIYGQRLEVRLEVCWTLGYMLGEVLAAAVLDGRVTPQELRDLVTAPRGPHPSIAYFALADRLARVAALPAESDAGRRV